MPSTKSPPPRVARPPRTDAVDQNHRVGPADVDYATFVEQRHRPTGSVQLDARQNRALGSAEVAPNRQRSAVDRSSDPGPPRRRRVGAGVVAADESDRLILDDDLATVCGVTSQQDRIRRISVEQSNVQRELEV